MTNDKIKRAIFTFGIRLAQARKDAGLSQTELGDLCEVSRDTISFIERGVYGPRFTLLVKLSMALNVPIAQLFEDE